MTNDHALHAERLEKEVSALSNALAHLNDADGFKRLIEILRHPGWTTPAEFTFATAITASLTAQAQQMTTLKNEFLKGSQQVIAK